MVEYKNQHYVPQTYQKGFSCCPRQVGQINIDTKQFNLVSIKNNLSKNYLYSPQISPYAKRQFELERSFSKMESDFRSAVSALKYQTYFSASPFEELLIVPDWNIQKFLSIYLSFQMQRHKECIDDVFVNHIGSSHFSSFGISEEDFNKNIYIENIVKNSQKALTRLSFQCPFGLIVRIDNNQSEFIFADYPVVQTQLSCVIPDRILNPLADFVGFPIDKNNYFILMSPFSKSWKEIKDKCFSQGAPLVDTLNLISIKNATHHIFLDSCQKKYVESLMSNKNKIYAFQKREMMATISTNIRLAEFGESPDFVHDTQTDRVIFSNQTGFEIK